MGSTWSVAPQGVIGAPPYLPALADAGSRMSLEVFTFVHWHHR